MGSLRPAFVGYPGTSYSSGAHDLGDWLEARGAIRGRGADERSGSRRCGQQVAGDEVQRRVRQREAIGGAIEVRLLGHGAGSEVKGREVN